MHGPRLGFGMLPIFLEGPPDVGLIAGFFPDIGFDLMMEYGNHVQTVAIDAARSVEDFFVS